MFSSVFNCSGFKKLLTILRPTDKENKWLRASYELANIFSTCSRKKYCAIIISKNGRVAGMGYNGGPSGLKHCSDGGCPRASLDVEHGSVYDNCIAIHAEANALLWSDEFLREGGTLIVNGPPCYGCAKLIANSGLGKVVFPYDSNYKNINEVINFLYNSKIQIAIGDQIA